MPVTHTFRVVLLLPLLIAWLPGCRTEPVGTAHVPPECWDLWECNGDQLCGRMVDCVEGRCRDDLPPVVVDCPGDECLDDQDSVVACRLKDLKLAADSVKPEGGILDA